jgi:RND family efflux transporter MFP subunit
MAIMSTLMTGPETATLHPPQRVRSTRAQPLISSGQRPAKAVSMSKRRTWWLLGTILATVGMVSFLPRLLSGRHSTSSLVTYAVARTDLPINVIERGSLESQFNERVICEVDDIRGDGLDGTPVIWIVENGSSVKKGDLLVELDSSSHRERLDSQILDRERALAEQIQATVAYENQISQNQTSEADARLQVALAELELRMFEDDENGSYQLEVEEINRMIEDVKNEILAAEASLKLKQNEYEGMESLFKLGYAGKSEVDRTQLDLLQAQGTYAAKINRLQTQLATLEKKENYEREMQKLQLEGNLETTRRNLKQVIGNNKAELAQAKAAKDAADRALQKEEERLARYQDELNKCKIYAPQDGMVSYESPRSRYSQSTQIGPGALLRERQPILALPNLSHMQVKTSVHESVQNQIQPGLPATIRLDAFSDRSYRGTVKSVAVLPEQSWMNDTKVYETVVSIDEEVTDLKPGMTAVVEIHVDVLQDVLCVPVQAIVQEKSVNWCYVLAADNTPERRQIEVGMTNDKFVEICDGIRLQEQVVLNPMAILDDLSDESDEETDSTGPVPESLATAGP